VPVPLEIGTLSLSWAFFARQAALLYWLIKPPRANLSTYLVSVCADTPSVEALFVDRPDPEGIALNARGFGETPGTGVPAAIGNAIYHAIGRRLREVPFTQDKLL
jgi:CO/xanthine dehydrogenase Mo-binding subunit